MPDQITTERAAIAADLCAWLAEQPHTSAVPVRVSIGRATYVGAYFAQIRFNDPGTRAYSEGRRHYVHAGYYLLGLLPPSYVHRNADAYVTGTRGATFYVSSYYGQNGERNDAHPFGCMFMLMPDTLGVVEGPRRMRMTVERIDR